MTPNRRQLLQAAQHVLRGRAGLSLDHAEGDEYLVCSCGWVSPEPVTWHDDVVVTDLNRHWRHASAYILIYTPGYEAMDGIVVSTNHGHPKRVPKADLQWLAEQDDVSPTLRAAVSTDLG